MNLKIATVTLFLLTIGMMASATETANAVVYCQYISYPAVALQDPVLCSGRARLRALRAGR